MYVFIGDVHGSLDDLEFLLAKLAGERRIFVFLGDYVNRGEAGPGVIDRLIELSESVDAVFVRGNHDQYLLDFIQNTEHSMELFAARGHVLIDQYKRYAAARTISELRAMFPPPHLEFLENTVGAFEGNDFIAIHELSRASRRAQKYVIAGHSVMKDGPSVGEKYALIDTGSGTGNGYLTALLWPERTTLDSRS